MKIAFYYHIPITIKEGGLYIPGYLGVFITSLAKEVESLYLLMHESRPGSSDVEEADYQLNESNISWVTLGIKTPAWHREIFHKKLLKSKLREIEDVDVFIVRSPTPLAAHFHSYVLKTQIWFMIVGDYLEAIDHLKKTGLRNRLIYYYLHINDYFFQRQVKVNPILVNSQSLFEKYNEVNEKVFLIRTTTLSASDLYWRNDTCLGETIHLLYTGSFTPAKGLFELIDALKFLVDGKMPVVLHFVGWEENSHKPVEQALLLKAKEMLIEEYIIFHGKKTVGAELNEMYRMADIYVMPSHHEGFPRTIWEAMANCLPVIATAVGGIPYILESERNALLIPPRSSIAIAKAVIALIGDSKLRQILIKEGFRLAKETTLEIQTKLLVEILKNNS